MAPTAQGNASCHKVQASPELDGESIVISGMSGLYPQSRSVQELSAKLYNKENPVTASKPRWKYAHPEVPPYTGVVPELDRFDAHFFKVHHRQATYMDSMSRKILEQAYQAIFDAGISPEKLSGKKVGVYVGCSFSESEKGVFYDPGARSGFGISGCSKTMYANRISYWLNAKGPSMAIDEACCSSLTALEQAVQDMRLGECEAAIVGGSNVCLHPQSSIHFGRLFPLCKDGKTKSFDHNCDGLARSEAINVLFLQKAKNAFRIYAHVLHVKSEFVSIMMGEKGPKFTFARNPRDTANFIQEFYNEVGVSPKAVEYVEAFGSAVPEADKSELEAISEVYCRDRLDPLFVGSIASNIGYSEAASGISAITKVLLAYQNGKLPANLHCSSPRNDIAALAEGRMRIVTEHQPFGHSYAAINALSYTGVNAHVLLHGYYKPKNLSKYKSNIPRLVTISGRHESAVKRIIDDLKSRPIDPEELALFHNVYEISQPGHMSRGFVVLDTDNEHNTVSLVENVDYFDDAKRPLWFVYSGMGSQWVSMGSHLMRIPIFSAAIEKCHKVLAPKGLDIVHILTVSDKTIFDNILHSFVGIAAIQIGLTDVLHAMGIVPDKIIGHSVGELGCGYADGCFTAEEMILSAYSRGLVSVQTPFIEGSMAAVGIGYQEIVKLCPPGIQVACHNGPESSTISGPAEVMREFVAKLTAQGIFAKEVPCSNIAFHSSYIAEAGPKLLDYLSEVIKSPKRRSDRWLSTSLPQERWGEENAQYCSAWYHTNNLLSPVLFEETSRLVPAGAVMVEIAPHGLLQAILKRSLHPDCRHIPVTKRGHPDNALFLLEAVGKIFVEGINPKVKELYPKVEFPVSTGTPMMSHLVEWSHTEKWMLPLIISSALRKNAAVCNYVISVHDDEHAYLKGNVVRGKTQYPFSAVLVAVWDTLAMSVGAKKKELSAEFRDVHLFSQPMLHDGQHLQFTVTFHWGSGSFEVMNGQSKVASGFISAEFNKDAVTEDGQENTTDLDVDHKEVYEGLKERSHFYSGNFCSIYKSNSSYTNAQIVWKDNWVTFMDGLLQLNILRRSHNGATQPSHINKFIIDVQAHAGSKYDQLENQSTLNAVISPVHGYTRCGGILIDKIEFYDLPSLENDTLLLTNCTFVSHFLSDCKNLVDIFKTYLQIVAENVTTDVVKVIEVTNNNEESIVDIMTLLSDISGCTYMYKQVDKNAIECEEGFLDADVVLVTHLSVDKKLLRILQRVICPGAFVINGEQSGEKNDMPSNWYRLVCVKSIGHATLELARWKPAKKDSFTSCFTVNTENDFTQLIAKRDSLQNNETLLVLSTYPPVEGLKDLIKKWRRESNRNQIYLASISRNETLERLPWASFDLDLAFNVFKDGVWGGEYFISWQENVVVKHSMTLQSGKIGDLESLHWVESLEPKGSGIKVTVRYAGVNDLDSKRATGTIPFPDTSDEHRFGMDFSGTTDSGEHVMGIVRGGAASGRVLAVPELLWPVPSHWTLEDAATVPLAYAQAFYCLGIKSQLYPGMTVLVHGGAGALGQAAISIALANQCEVFATVSSTRKKHFLRKLFPALREDHISNSRDESFSYMVLQATKGKGCDIIISCVKGGLKNTTLNCASYCGITFDTVQAHIGDNYSYGMYYMTKQRSYVVLDFDNVFDYEDEMKALQEMMSEGIACGYVKPLSRVTYAAQDVARAFQLLTNSRHRGRVLLRLRDSIIPTQPRIICSPDKSHLLFCDGEELGIQLADRLIKRGARKLHLHCPPAVPHNLQYKLGVWKKQGVLVEVSVNILSSSNVLDVLNDANKMAPLESLYVIISASFDEKLISNLDLVTRKLCPSLKYFALLTSKSSVAQNVALSRAQENLPVTAIQLPPWTAASGPWNGILDVIERATHASQPVMLVQSRQKQELTLLQQIAVIADVEVPSGVDQNTALKYFGFDSSKAPAVCAFLLNTYNVSLGEQEIPLLTVKKIEEIEKSLIEPDFNDVTGLGAFFSFLDPDELEANVPTVFMPTIVQDYKSQGEIDANQNYLCILPGLEGHHERFRTLCQRLKMPALVLQPGVGFVHESLQDMARRYIQNLRRKIHVQDNFYLLGYESSIKLALAIAANLEKEGLTGTVFCVGGTPDEVQAIVEDKLQCFSTEDALQNAIILHMSELMAKGTSAEIEIALKRTSSWQDKLNLIVNYLLGRVSPSKQYTRMIIEAAYARIKQLRHDSSQPPQLKSLVVILRAAQGTFATPAEDLQRYSQQPVLTYNLRAPLAHSAKDPRCAAVINRHLSKEILVNFENLNICESLSATELYLVNRNR